MEKEAKEIVLDAPIEEINKQIGQTIKTVAGKIRMWSRRKDRGKRESYWFDAECRKMKKGVRKSWIRMKNAKKVNSESVRNDTKKFLEMKSNFQKLIRNKKKTKRNTKS